MATSTIQCIPKDKETISLTYETGISDGRSSDLKSWCERSGDLVTLQINAQSTTAFSTTYKTVMTLPEAVRPPEIIMGAASFGNSLWNMASIGGFQISPSTGEVSIYCGASNQTFVKFCVSYLV